jgi:hypothetical protein
MGFHSSSSLYSDCPKSCHVLPPELAIIFPFINVEVRVQCLPDKETIVTTKIRVVKHEKFVGRSLDCYLWAAYASVVVCTPVS